MKRDSSRGTFLRVCIGVRQEEGQRGQSVGAGATWMDPGGTGCPEFLFLFPAFVFSEIEY